MFFHIILNVANSGKRTLDQRYPVGVVIRMNVTRDQEEDVHHPPNPQPP